MRHAMLLFAALLGLGPLLTPAGASDVRILSAAAVTPGLEQVLGDYRSRAGQTVTVTYATGPEIKQRIGDGERGFDIVVAPEAVLRELAQQAKVQAKFARLGAVGISVGIKPGAPRPDLSGADAVRRALLAAKTIVISRGSTGVYLESLFQKMGIGEQVASKIERARNGEAVVERILRGDGDEIGLTAQTELAGGLARGLIIVGPLPPEIQADTVYAAAALPDAASRPEVLGFMTLLESVGAKRSMTVNGIR